MSRAYNPVTASDKISRSRSDRSDRSSGPRSDGASGGPLTTPSSFGMASNVILRIDETRGQIELTPDAIELRLGAALPAVFEVGKEREFGRSERDRPATNDLPITMRLAEPPTPFELVRSA